MSYKMLLNNVDGLEEAFIQRIQAYALLLDASQKPDITCCVSHQEDKAAMRKTKQTEDIAGLRVTIERYGVPDEIRIDSGNEIRQETKQSDNKGFVRADDSNPYHAKCKRWEREAKADKEAAYYEGIIQGTIQARNGVEKVIQNITQKDAGMVLAAIGLDHPASKIVLKYLEQQKLSQIDPLKNNILKVLISHQV